MLVAIVKTDVPMTARLCEETILELAKAYPFLRTELLTETAFGRKIRTLVLGRGPRKVIYSAAHHANEWITTPILMKFLEEFCESISQNQSIFGMDARTLFEQVTLHMVPMVNPDGVDLVTGAIAENSPEYETAQTISAYFPFIPFPDGWKANLNGVDLNLNYPAEWEQARKNKFALGFDRPAPRDFVGQAPLDQIESAAMVALTEELDPRLTLSYHSQGEVIYWKFLDIEPPEAEQIGQTFARISGYTLEDTPYASGFAGYKDWYILKYNRPGYTIEVGNGTNPLPISQFAEIYEKNLGILAMGLAL